MKNFSESNMENRLQEGNIITTVDLMRKHDKLISSEFWGRMIMTTGGLGLIIAALFLSPPVSLHIAGISIIVMIAGFLVETLGKKGICENGLLMIPSEALSVINATFRHCFKKIWISYFTTDGTELPDEKVDSIMDVPPINSKKKIGKHFYRVKEIVPIAVNNDYLILHVILIENEEYTKAKIDELARSKYGKGLKGLIKRARTKKR